MLKRTGSYLITVLILSLLLNGCQSADQKKIRETILNYNQNLPKALVRPNPEVIVSFVGDREFVHVSTFIMKMASEKKVMDSRLGELKITGIELSKSGREHPVKEIKGNGQDTTKIYAIARTKEVWEFRYLDYDTKKALGPFKKISYEGEYLMGREKDKWVIELLEIK
ncbi:MAG: hypothetical protein ACYC21_11145 [Eubacteriales bacterium]